MDRRYGRYPIYIPQILELENLILYTYTSGKHDGLSILRNQYKSRDSGPRKRTSFLYYRDGKPNDFYVLLYNRYL